LAQHCGAVNDAFDRASMKALCAGCAICFVITACGCPACRISRTPFSGLQEAAAGRARAYHRNMSSSLYLVHMANDIGNFFCGQQPRELAITGIANHMKSFWTHRMREKLISQMEHDDDGLDELPREALRYLAEHPAFTATQQPGGDAG
jgi:formate dehydrogenase subunit delta